MYLLGKIADGESVWLRECDCALFVIIPLLFDGAYLVAPSNDDTIHNRLLIRIRKADL